MFIRDRLIADFGDDLASFNITKVQRLQQRLKRNEGFTMPWSTAVILTARNMAFAVPFVMLNTFNELTHKPQISPTVCH